MSSRIPHVAAPARRLTARAHEPSRLALRARVLLHAGRLDAALAAGADPSASPELGLRADRLTSARHRRTLAGRIEEVIRLAEQPGPRLSAAPPLAKRDVRDARAALLDLSQALRVAERVAPAGVVLARRLLSDGAGPLYVHCAEDALWHAVRAASAALEVTRRYR
jgi:hypothetical protein